MKRYKEKKLNERISHLTPQDISTLSNLLFALEYKVKNNPEIFNPKEYRSQLANIQSITRLLDRFKTIGY